MAQTASHPPNAVGGSSAPGGVTQGSTGGLGGGANNSNSGATGVSNNMGANSNNNSNNNKETGRGDQAVSYNYFFLDIIFFRLNQWSLVPDNIFKNQIIRKFQVRKLILFTVCLHCLWNK